MRLRLAVAIALLAAAPASATTVSLDGPELAVTGEGAEANVIRLSFDSATVLVTDAVPVHPGAGWSSDGEQAAVCPLPAAGVRVIVGGGDGDDDFEVPGAVASGIVDGGAGQDRLTRLAPGLVELRGGAGTTR